MKNSDEMMQDHIFGSSGENKNNEETKTSEKPKPKINDDLTTHMFGDFRDE